MLRIITSTCLAGLIVALAGCQKTEKMAAAPDGVAASEVEIGAGRTIAVLDFSSNTRDAVAQRAMRAFLDSFRASHPEARIIEIGSEQGLLSAVRHGRLDAYALESVRERFGFDAILAGEFEVERTWPAGPAMTWEELCELNEQSTLEATLRVSLMNTATGEMIWTNAARQSTPYAATMPEGLGSEAANAGEMNDPYANLILALVRQVAGEGPAGVDEPIVRTAVVEP